MERKNLALYVGIFAALLGGAEAFAEKSGFLGKNSVEARRVLLRRVGGEDRSLVWARAVSALVFLERLSGNGEEARKVWARCDAECRKLLPQDERAALEAWQK